MNIRARGTERELRVHGKQCIWMHAVKCKCSVSHISIGELNDTNELHI